MIFDEHDYIFSGNISRYVGGINTQLLNPIVSKYVLDKKPLLYKYIDNLLLEQIDILNKTEVTKKADYTFIATIISSFDQSYIRNLCIYYFLLVYTYQDSENDKNYAAVPVSINIGKKMFRNYSYLSSVKTSKKKLDLSIIITNDNSF